MPTHPFLSDEWIDEARRVRDELRASAAGAVPADVRINLVVKAVPFGPGTIDAHVDTSSGELDVEVGHLADADMTLTLDYDTARSILVDLNAQAAMQAFLGGRIKVQGDMTKLLVLQGVLASPDASAGQAAERIRSITS